ncbi:hypothetical protein FO519_000041 [Halicephalobus sp. NKZ332]|nr:hypothetical protein FO519_000041 [Halicephalobus sp. NKZ332]
MKVIIFFMVIQIASSQPWFDYEGYEPVPITSIHVPSTASYRSQILMRGVPRYRPSVSPIQQQQLAGLAEPDYRNPRTQQGLEIATASAFGGAYGSREPEFEPRPNPDTSVSDFMSRLVTTIPEIAEKMAKMVPPEPRQKINTGVYTFAPEIENNYSPDFAGNVKKSGIGMFFVTDPAVTTESPKDNGEEEKSVASLVHSMPVPESLFSFNKLFSAFSGITPAPDNGDFPKNIKVKEDEVVDMRLIKGTPILKDEDESSEFVQKPDEFVESPPPSTEAPDPADNLLGTILSGKLDKVDWLGAFFNKNSIPGAGEQNPISQFLKGGIFGSGLDDDPKIKKSDDPSRSGQSLGLYKTYVSRSSLAKTMVKIHILIFFISFWMELEGFSMLKTSWDFVLPRSALCQLQMIEANDSLSRIGVERAVDQILVQQDDDILSQLEIPSYFSQLPEVARWQIKDVLFHSNLTYAEKQEVIVDLLARLPPGDRKFPKIDRCRENLPGAKSMYFDSYSAITYTVRFTFPLTEISKKLPSADYKALYNTFRHDNYTIDERLDQLLEIMIKQSPSVRRALFASENPIPEEIIETLFFFDSAKDHITEKRNMKNQKQTQKEQQSTLPAPPKKPQATKKPLRIFGKESKFETKPKDLKSLIG